MNKIKVKDIVNFDADYFTGFLDDLPRKIKEVKGKFTKEGWEDLELKMYYYYGDTELQLTCKRLETDMEFTDRVKKESIKLKRQEKQKERELEQLRKLKEKYE